MSGPITAKARPRRARDHGALIEVPRRGEAVRSLADLAARIKAEHEATGLAVKRGLEHSIAAGNLLIEAKKQLAHGAWLPWLRDCCQVPERTARHYMRLARHGPELSKIGNVADFTVSQAAALTARSHRVAKILATCNGDTPFPTGRRFPVVLADCPWQFRNTIDPSRRLPYATMALEKICALPISDLVTPAAALFLWAPGSHLPEALQVMTAWGFEYRSNIAWDKGDIGLGHWVRNQHELLLIGARGKMPPPPPSARPPSVIRAPRREHSRKPDEAYAVIEKMFPSLPKIELFARHARPNWAAWGNQAPVAKREAAHAA